MNTSRCLAGLDEDNDQNATEIRFRVLHGSSILARELVPFERAGEDLRQK